jgi:hypothetical protein
MATTVKTTVNLPETEYQTLKELAERRQISFTHALRQAIQSELFIQSLVDRSAKLLVQYDDGNLQELVFTQAAGPAAATPAPAQAAGPAVPA